MHKDIRTITWVRVNRNHVPRVYDSWQEAIEDYHYGMLMSLNHYEYHYKPDHPINEKQ